VISDRQVLSFLPNHRNDFFRPDLLFLKRNVEGVQISRNDKFADALMCFYDRLLCVYSAAAADADGRSAADNLSRVATSVP